MTFNDMKSQSDKILEDLSDKYKDTPANLAALLFVSPITNTVEYRVGLFPDHYEARLWLHTVSAEYHRMDITYSCYINGVYERSN